MPTRISPKQFRASDGVDDWAAFTDGVEANFMTGSFATGVELVISMGRLADEAQHHPDVDLRYSSLLVRLFAPPRR